MTKRSKNEEKAREFANYFACETDYKESAAYSSAMAMAEWKDEQFEKQERQLIDKACEWMKNNINDYYTTNEFEQWFDEMFDDFKQAMKEK